MEQFNGTDKPGLCILRGDEIMKKWCPHCQSTEDPEVINTLWSEDGWTAYRINTYVCPDCGATYEGSAKFESDGIEELII